MVLVAVPDHPFVILPTVPMAMGKVIAVSRTNETVPVAVKRYPVPTGMFQPKAMVVGLTPVPAGIEGVTMDCNNVPELFDN